MKTFVLAASWWCDSDIQMNIVKANSKEEVLKQFIVENNEDSAEGKWAESSIDDCLAMMGVTCGVIEIP